jgi:hypothetical protein
MIVWRRTKGQNQNEFLHKPLDRGAVLWAGVQSYPMWFHKEGCSIVLVSLTNKMGWGNADFLRAPLTQIGTTLKVWYQAKSNTQSKLPNQIYFQQLSIQ